MKKIYGRSIFTVILFFALCTAAPAFQCGSKIIVANDPKEKVLRNCGEPASINEWEEERIARGYGRTYMPEDSIPQAQRPVAAVLHVRVEEWTYNFGPNQFMRILRFENGRLIDINSGDYGYR